MEEITQDLFVTFEIKDTASAKNNLFKTYQLMCLWMWDICWLNGEESDWNPRAWNTVPSMGWLAWEISTLEG